MKNKKPKVITIKPSQIDGAVLPKKTIVKKQPINKTKILTISAVLTAFAFVVPYFMPSFQPIPGITVTPGSHLAIMLAIFINPYVAVATTFATTMAFFLKMPLPVVGLRAAMHIFFVIVGCIMVKNMKDKLWKVCTLNGIIAAVHAFSEILAVYVAFLMFPEYEVSIRPFYVFVAVGLASFIQSLIEFHFAYMIFVPLDKAKLLNYQR